MTNIKKFSAVAFAGIVLLAYLMFTGFKPAYGSAPSGLQANHASTTAILVGPSKVFDPATTTLSVWPILFPAQINCASRVVTTKGDSAIMLSFGALSSSTLSGSAGHWQGASTTVAYDGGIYGCGLLSALGYSSTTVTTSEFR